MIEYLQRIIYSPVYITHRRYASLAHAKKLNAENN